MAQTTYNITNWSHYNHALIQRGSLSVWISEEAAQRWRYDGPPQWGTDPVYSDFAIETCLRLRLVYDLPLRQTQGFVASLFRLMDLDLPVPDYSTLSRRAKDLSVDLCAGPEGSECTSEGASEGEDEGEAAPRHVVIDSTGLKVYGEGEWKQRQHGKSKRRTWRKIHVSLDPETGEITAERLTDNSKHDASQIESLLEETLKTTGPVTHVGGDGAYDTWDSYDAIEAADAQPVIPPQKNAKIKRHGNCKGPPLPRDEAIRYIRRHGRTKWKRVHGYHRRSLVETGIYRFKRLIGRVLRSREPSRQRTEARLGCQILNRMLRLGMPESYAVQGG
jgi:hypothetical protein